MLVHSDADFLVFLHVKPVLKGFVFTFFETLVMQARVLLQPLPQVLPPPPHREECWLPSSVHFPGTGSRYFPPTGGLGLLPVTFSAAVRSTSTPSIINTGMEAIFEMVSEGWAMEEVFS